MSKVVATRNERRVNDEQGLKDWIGITVPSKTVCEKRVC